MQLTVLRELHNCTKDSTPGTMLIDGELFGVTLEDARRGHGVKVKGETCIPEGCYIVSVTHSNRWNKPMLQLWNTADKAVFGEGIRFTGIRIHGGNNHHDTAGCILVAEHRDSFDRIKQSKSNELFRIVEAAIIAGENVFIEVTNA